MRVVLVTVVAFLLLPPLLLVMIYGSAVFETYLMFWVRVFGQ